MCDYAKCKKCEAIFEKKKINKFLSRYSKGFLGKEKLCIDCIHAGAHVTDKKQTPLFENYFTPSQQENV